MDAIFKKMNFKDQKIIHCLNAPESFEKNLHAMKAIAETKRDLKKNETPEFIIAFCTKLKEIENIAKQVAKTVHDDALVWISYPKGSSKKYVCEFNRDNGWQSLGDAGFEPVRQVAIDEDWSALRFRKVECIRTMTRSFAMTKEGRAKITRAKN